MSTKRKIFSITFLLIACISLIYAYLVRDKAIKNDYKSVSINGHIFKIEVVRSDYELQKGLGDRDNICRNCGMLFIFPKTGKYNFWMKDMRFPIDILWIQNGYIVQMEKNVKSDSKNILIGNTDSEYVLEVNAGIVDDDNIKQGDNVNFHF